MVYQNIKLKIFIKINNYFNKLVNKQISIIQKKKDENPHKFYFKGFRWRHPYNTWKKLNNK